MSLSLGLWTPPRDYLTASAVERLAMWRADLQELLVQQGKIELTSDQANYLISALNDLNREVGDR